MQTIYIYVLDTLADWEIGYLTSEMNSGRFFKKDAKQIKIKMVSDTKSPISTMGGLTIVPDCLVADILVNQASLLVLPGAETWHDPKHVAIIEKASALLAVGATVAVICGATVAAANAGLLDSRRHTSNGPGFLDMFSLDYKGQSYYVEAPSVADDHLMTASSTGALLWTKQIIEQLDVFQSDTLAYWYDYFRTGDVSHFYALMATLPVQ